MKNKGRTTESLALFTSGFLLGYVFGAGRNFIISTPPILSQVSSVSSLCLHSISNTSDLSKPIEENSKEMENETVLSDRPTLLGEVFLSYTPSKFEVEWSNHIHEYKDRECAVLATSPYREWVQQWLDVSLPSTLLRDSQGWKAPQNLTPDVFSVFRYKMPSGGVQEVWVEPLGGILRDPREPCKLHSNGFWTPHNPDIQSKDFLLFDSSLAKLSRSRVLLFDLGSSKYEFFMPGLSWFYPKYKSEGFQVNDVFAWEITPRTGLEYFDGMPTELAAATHFYNFGVDANVNSIQNPLQVLKLTARKEDYVIFKLDIDNIPIEEAIVESLLADPVALELIDDFFWEHHVNQIDMNPRWGITQGLPKTIKDSIVYFRKLREKGIRSHSWP